MAFDFALSELLAFGTLPAIRTDVRDTIDILDAYTSTYLREEIQQESLIRDLPSFSRFLEVAALANGQVSSVASIARDAGVARPTVQRHFDVLVDTLIGLWVRPWKANARVNEVGHPKFYFFDTGVVRALRGATREPVERAERGPLLETLVLHELGRTRPSPAPEERSPAGARRRAVRSTSSGVVASGQCASRSRRRTAIAAKKPRCCGSSSSASSSIPPTSCTMAATSCTTGASRSFPCWSSCNGSPAGTCLRHSPAG